MADVQVEFRAGAVLAMLGELASATQDLRPWFAQYLSPRLTVLFSKQFSTQGRFGGTAWPPLAAVTRDYKARHGLDPRPLVATGHLMASFAGGADAIERMTPLSYVRGTAVPYYGFHHTGTGRMPRRQVIPEPMPTRETETWAANLVRWLERRAQRAATTGRRPGHPFWRGAGTATTSAEVRGGEPLHW